MKERATKQQAVLEDCCSFMDLGIVTVSSWFVEDDVGEELGVNPTPNPSFEQTELFILPKKFNGNDTKGLHSIKDDHEDDATYLSDEWMGDATTVAYSIDGDASWTIHIKSDEPSSLHQKRNSKLDCDQSMEISLVPSLVRDDESDEEQSEASEEELSFIDFLGDMVFTNSLHGSRKRVRHGQKDTAGRTKFIRKRKLKSGKMEWNCQKIQPPDQILEKDLELSGSSDVPFDEPELFPN